MNRLVADEGSKNNEKLNEIELDKEEAFFLCGMIDDTAADDGIHVMSHPTGWYDTHNCQVTGGKECLAYECKAFSHMASWGFDPFLDDLPHGKRLCDRFAKVKRI